MMVLLRSFWDGGYGFYTVRIGAIQANEYRIQLQNYLNYSKEMKRQQGFTTQVGFIVYAIS